MSYTAFDMIRSMRNTYLLKEPEAPERRGSRFRFIAAVQGFFSR